jgi:hypothetical protein
MRSFYRFSYPLFCASDFSKGDQNDLRWGDRCSWLLVFFSSQNRIHPFLLIVNRGEWLPRMPYFDWALVDFGPWMEFWKTVSKLELSRDMILVIIPALTILYLLPKHWVQPGSNTESGVGGAHAREAEIRASQPISQCHQWREIAALVGLFQSATVLI